MSISYKYFCPIENIDIHEIRNEDQGPPTLCKNSHPIENSSVHVTALHPRVFRFDINPEVTDDRSHRYSLGDRWINTTTNREFVCIDSSDIANAKWILACMRYPDIYATYTSERKPYIELNGDFISFGGHAYLPWNKIYIWRTSFGNCFTCGSIRCWAYQMENF